MPVKTFGCVLECMQTTTVTIELSRTKGHQRVISGLPDDTVKESLVRIESAIAHAGYPLPEAKWVYNLHPASLPKRGTGLDLPMAVALLAAGGHIHEPETLDQYLLFGEISLDGSLQPICGALSIALQAWKEKFAGVIVPSANVEEAAMVTKIPVYGATTLNEVVQFLNGRHTLEPVQINTRALFYDSQFQFEWDYGDVIGQPRAKRAMEIVAAGSHNAILIGPPGSGKSMIAERLATILPPLTLAEALDVTQIYSLCGQTDPARKGLISQRPFVSSHYSTSIPGLIGGGTVPMPGLITKAHHGVLFLDELAEYSRAAIESIRMPLETGEVRITRAMKTVVFPASFILVAATNPCPCGYFQHPKKRCSCSPKAIQKYLSKISGPILDRVDMHIEVMALSGAEWQTDRQAENSATIRSRVLQARAIQTDRFENHDQVHNNAQMTPAMIRKHCSLDSEAATLLDQALQHLPLSGRAHDRILKVSRTIADLDNASAVIRFPHVSEAIGYRSLDKESWLDRAAANQTSSASKKNLYKII